MSILNAACHKVTRPMGYDNIRVWRRDFEIACSLWKKHYIDETRKQHRQEDVITMYLEPNRDDRDYLYGRLLALADNFEESVLRKQGVKDRPTNAIKLMSNFTAKPYTTWGTLWKQLTPYLKSANGGSWFRNEVDDVMALFIRMTKPWRKCHYGQLKESCVSRIRVLRLLLWGAAANWAFLWHSIHREVIITVPC